MNQIFVLVLFIVETIACCMFLTSSKTNCLFHQNKIASGGRFEVDEKTAFVTTFYTWMCEIVWVSMYNYNQGQITINWSKKQGYSRFWVVVTYFFHLDLK